VTVKRRPEERAKNVLETVFPELLATEESLVVNQQIFRDSLVNHRRIPHEGHGTSPSGKHGSIRIGAWHMGHSFGKRSGV
jgi:hypothetical protein